MKNLRKDNKGFSLVELIVVVLIMAIIAVALAPQVMKWVNNSRITADQNACGNIKTAVQSAVADFQAKGGKVGAADASYTLSGTTVSDTGSTNWTNGANLKTCIDNALGGETYKTKYDASDVFDITVKGSTGAVTVSCDASSVSLE